MEKRLLEDSTVQRSEMKDAKRSKGIGSVLIGGGRGAYYIGVWKAFRKTRLDKYVSAIRKHV